ncbi:TRAP transporter large permease [Atrimonas thermophila]|uniref:TRAP transporter large permease n=1 Tax=Atrimonas thermophila TaxID=3064161 RepID=UPI00399CF0D4
MSGILLLVCFGILLLLKVPLGVSFVISSALYLLLNGLPITCVAQRMVNSISYSFPLLAVPLFIFLGSLMNTTQLTRRIFDAAKLFVGSVRGGLAYVNVLASLIFSGISGAALADVGGLGNIEMKAMRDEGYSDEASVGITLASGTIGPIFPPSIPLIIYAAVAEVSGVRLLIAGVIPGILIAAFLCVLIAFFAKRRNYPVHISTSSSREKWKTIKETLPILILPPLLVGSLLMGWFGPTEIGAVACVYTILISRFVYRELSLQKFWLAVKEAIRSTALIMFTVASASIFAWCLTVAQVPQNLTSLMLSVSQNPIVLLLFTNLLLLAIGTFMESISAILVITPLVTPMLVRAGVDPVHIGIVIVLNLMIGLLTPPVGMSLYMGSIVTGIPFERITKYIVPWLLPLLLSLLVVTFIPQLSLWLPSLIFGK